MKKSIASISRECIEKCLKLFEFGPSYRLWIQTLGQKSNALVAHNEYMSRTFPLERGCPQGDPISPYLFVLGVQILNTLVKRNEDIQGVTIEGQEYIITQYADDTEFILNGSENSLQASLDTLISSRFQASG